MQSLPFEEYTGIQSLLCAYLNCCLSTIPTTKSKSLVIIESFNVCSTRLASFVRCTASPPPRRARRPAALPRWRRQRRPNSNWSCGRGAFSHRCRRRRGGSPHTWLKVRFDDPLRLQIPPLIRRRSLLSPGLSSTVWLLYV